MAAPSTRPHTRSFSGCDTCRSRHVKCDEGRPTCSMCEDSGLSCPGYRKGIIFDFEKPTINDSGIRFRRTLQTERERECMSRYLISSAPPKSASRLLSQIDDECDVAARQDIQVSRGPFGAFRLSEDQSVPSSEPLMGEFEGSVSFPQSRGQNTESYGLPFDDPLSPWVQELLQPTVDEAGQLQPGLPCLDFLPLMTDSDQNYSMASQSCQPPIPRPNTDIVRPMSPPPIHAAMCVDQDITRAAVPLLKHYSSTVISLMTPVRHSKTPWHVLFIPHVKNCLAALTLGEKLDHASLCAFYGTLAISAFSLGGVSRSQAWVGDGRSYMQQAHEHAALMLRTAYDIPKVAKYKSILMALLTMVQLSMFSGSRGQAEDYFLEAEKLIRLRGLKRKKSRKVRLLHHCYVFERLFYESTFISAGDSTKRRHVREVVESSGLIRYSHDSLSFRLPTWNSLDQRMSESKSQEVGENDLHLERPGVFSATLYPEIFGVPELWAQGLSLVIRLANEKDAAEQDWRPNCLGMRDFISWAKSIEQLINHLEPPRQTTIGHDSQVNQVVMKNMLDAVQQALAIYFYRRIYDVEASILQQKVVGVRDCLLRCEAADSSVVYGSAGFIWPAFIAACEAEDPMVQSSFADWFDNAAQRSGLSRFTDTLRSIRQIWQEKAIARTSVTCLT